MNLLEGKVIRYGNCRITIDVSRGKDLMGLNEIIGKQ